MPATARCHRQIAAPRHANSPTPPSGEKPLLFLDFEASSLGEGSWPVEIGFAWIEGGRVQVTAVIIAPRPSWSMDDWSEVAAQCHGITLDAVRSGRPAASIAADTERFRDFTVVSDNPRWEQCWLDKLRANRKSIKVHSLRSVAGSRLSAEEANGLALNLLRSEAPHRAGADAARLAAAWLAATRAARAQAA